MNFKEQLKKAEKYAQSGKFGEAESIYLDLINKNPNDTSLLSIYGYLCLKARDFEKASDVLSKAYAYSKESNIPIVKGLAISKLHSNQIDDAIRLYIELIELEPVYNNYRILSSLLSDKISLGKTEYYYSAKKYIEEAYKKFPIDPDIMLNYATYKFYSGDFDTAESMCRQVLKNNPTLANGWELLGIIYESLYCDELNAQECHKKSIEFGAKSSGYYNLAVSYGKTGNYREAIECFDKALELNPQNSKIINNSKASVYMKNRDFENGYKLFVQDSDSPYFNVLENKWDGQTNKDKTLLVLADMCFGDHIFFARYLPYLKDKFAKVYVQVYDTLRAVFENSFEGIYFIKKDAIPKYDYYVPMSHLPYYLCMDFDNIPYKSGYLVSNNADIKSDKLKIGLCWEAGNIDVRNTIHRTINISEFKNLLKEDFEFYSFQVGGVMDISKYPNIHDLKNKIKSFEDTAKYLMSMDVLISVDTSVANLSGALGVKTCMLIPYYSDWRWFDNTEKTEWYDSVKIYKQTEKHSWQNEINRIINDLKLIKK